MIASVICWQFRMSSILNRHAETRRTFLLIRLDVPCLNSLWAPNQIDPVFPGDVHLEPSAALPLWSPATWSVQCVSFARVKSDLSHLPKKRSIPPGLWSFCYSVDWHMKHWIVCHTKACLLPYVLCINYGHWAAICWLYHHLGCAGWHWLESGPFPLRLQLWRPGSPKTGGRFCKVEYFPGLWKKSELEVIF